MNFQEMLAEQQNLAKSGELYKTDEPKFKSDERFYVISKDQDGNGSVRARFLPSLNSKKSGINYYAKRLVHNIKNERLLPGASKPEIRGFWGEDAICPKTKNSNSKCPICENGWEIYNDAGGKGTDKKITSPILSNWISRDELITNILILDDKVNPSNNGKVFLFKLSKTVLDIFQKENERVLEICAGSDEEKSAQGIPSNISYFDAFDMFTGKNITLKFKCKKFIKAPSDYWGSSYLDSTFTSVVKNNEEAEELINKTYCLDEFTINSVIKGEEFLSEKVDYLMFRDSKKKAPQQSEPAGANKAQPPINTTVVNEVQQTPTPTITTAHEAPIKEEEKVEVKTETVTQQDFFAKFQVK